MSPSIGILMTQFMAWCAIIVPKLLGALVVFIVGKFLINKVMNILDVVVRNSDFCNTKSKTGESEFR